MAGLTFAFLLCRLRSNSRGERIRTSDLSVPNRAHYQAVLRPVKQNPILDYDRPAVNVAKIGRQRSEGRRRKAEGGRQEDGRRKAKGERFPFSICHFPSLLSG